MRIVPTLKELKDAHFCFLSASDNVCKSESKKILGFGAEESQSRKHDASDVDKQMTKYFRKEFLGRVDRIVSFQPIDSEGYKTLLHKKLYVFSGELLSKYKIQLNVTDAAKKAFWNISKNIQI